MGDAHRVPDDRPPRAELHPHPLRPGPRVHHDLPPPEPPSDDPESVEIIRGPNIKPLPEFAPVADTLRGHVLLRVGDNVTTDHIMPAGAKILPLRSNVPAISEYVFWRLDPDFVRRAKEWGGGFVVGGANYGQGSSREHAALCPQYLGLRVVLAQSFARIHEQNLIAAGVLALTFAEAADYDALASGDTLRIEDIRRAIAQGRPPVVRVVNKARTVTVDCAMSDRQREIFLAGGLINWFRGRRT